jgi:ubiquitin carboxyl-terminal hydrolase 8
MSAAAALPYPNGGPAHAARPSGPNGGGERVFEHINDLKEKSREGYNPQNTIPQLLQVAESGLNQATNLNTNFRRPDLAFVEYLRAADIVTEVIPRHRSYASLEIDHPEWRRKWDLLSRKVLALGDQYSNIRQIIVHNNSRSGVQAKNAHTGHARTESAPVINGASSEAHKVKPTPSPKPDKLHGRAISTANASVNSPSGSNQFDALSARFASLRRPIVDTTSDSSPSSVHSSPITMPSAGDFNSRASFDLLSRPSKPAGPRGMPNGDPLPPISIPNFPQPPAATYSPARNMETTGNIAPPRHSARSLAGTNARRSSMAPTSSASSYAPNGGSQGSDYFPASTNGNMPAQPSRRTSTNVSAEPIISAQRLYDYIQRYQILLIDFRHRHEFDEGHIYATHVICVDPLQIRPGMSAEQLADSLEVNPQVELDNWNIRNSFDYVVYYDNDTQAAYPFRELSEESAQALRSLHECLVDFNNEKPLLRAPLLLRGGLEAWKDLVGPQALMSSDTAARAKQNGGIRRRALATRPPAGGNLRIPKRSLRNVDQLDEEEEKKWRERARAESVVLPQAPETTQEEQGEGNEGMDGGNESDRAIKEFLQRFPDAGNLDRQAFASQQPSRAPPPLPAKIPEYPTAPPPSTYPQAPQAPARPAPAAPRMSYTGVSDRAVSATTPQPRTSSGQTYISPKYLNLRLPRTGLVNFGQTCYMNSVIQALSSTTPLSIFYLDDGFRNQLQRDNALGSKGVLSELYSNVIRSLWKGDVECIRPTTFRAYVRRISDAFDNEDQQDAMEFLALLIDQLHEETNTNYNRTILRALTEKEEALRERMPKLIAAKTEWSRHTHRSLSFVNNLFAGQYASRLTCLTCNFTSTTYEAFTSISVEIPQDQHKWITNGGRLPSLEDCLRSFCSQEELGADNAWHCKRCKTMREASKRITITRAPSHLIIHFKRFATNASGRAARKVRIPVDFPLKGLDLGPYTLPPPSPEEAQVIARDYGLEQLKTDISMSPPYTYDAYAVVRHIGATIASGHYVTVAKDPARRCWRVFNDKYVHDFQPEQLPPAQRLQNEEAYIVFYQRVHPSASGGGKI